MLLITRRENEAIVVNGSITVKVLEIRGGRVKLGFDFPVGNTVYREELFAKIQAENLAAAQRGKAAEGLGAALQSLQQKINQPTTERQHDQPTNTGKHHGQS